MLSAGTESFDRGDKASGCRAIPSLKHHVLVSQTARHVEVFTRQADDAWLLREYRGEDGEGAAFEGSGELANAPHGALGDPPATAKIA